MRFHVMGLPFTQTNRRYCACAYTTVLTYFCKAMHARGHEIIHYGAEGAEVPCEHVSIFSKQEQLDIYGPYDPQSLDNGITFDPESRGWLAYNRRASAEIGLRAKRKDFVCHLAGQASQSVATVLGDADVMHVEPFIGYGGTFARYRAFCSYAMMHGAWFREQGFNADGKNYDVVVPNLYDLNEFPEGNGGDYLLFVGRLIARKGLNIAIQAAAIAGKKLIIAGQGGKMEGNVLVTTDGQRFTGDFEYVGHVNAEQKAKLMGGALALMVPTIYVEPFGCVNIEAQIAGTPAITSDWGGFVDTVEHGVSGYRCRTLDHYVWAVNNAKFLDREAIRARAISLYSFDKVASMYEEWFSMLVDIWDDGWLTANDGRKNLSWLTK